ncbi:probable tRNA(His) guanylyltransferase [Microplitis mediator]|uniref:probable tRNA(His) guanylyltransferase n=1 Tax=Microplitis mediator TaxID=375433 RepID=UPI002556E8B5|nr:probable tRNA(His) guanylyltransferase [Microplitis mediator]
MQSLFKKVISSVNTKIYRSFKTSPTIAESMSEYYRKFEVESVLWPNSWIVVRVDGKNFSKFSDDHKFSKPNDIRALELMNQSAAAVMNEFPDIVLAYGQSDEYSFVFERETKAYNREAIQLASILCSAFTGTFASQWPKVGLTPRKYPVSFGGRVGLFALDQDLRGYLSWRQADVHENNLYNTCFWNLVQKKNMTPAQAQEALEGTSSSDKNELLFHSFNINYNNEPEIFRKGSTLIKKLLPDDTGKWKPTVITLTADLIGDKFWEENPQILEPKAHKKKPKVLKKI